MPVDAAAVNRAATLRDTGGLGDIAEPPPEPIVSKPQSEWALILFTVLVPAAFGLTLCNGLQALAYAAGTNISHTPMPAGVACALATIGMVSSVAHLAKPLRAPFSLRNWRGSWLSREILCVSLFWACLAAWFMGTLGIVGAAWFPPLAQVLSCIVGTVLLMVIATAYRICACPFWNGPEGMVELTGAALGIGAPLAALLTDTMPNAVWVMLLAVMATGLMCDMHAALRRRSRLHRSARTKDGRQMATSRSMHVYEAAWKRVRSIWVLDGCGIAALTIAWIAPSSAATTALLLVACVLQALAHMWSRMVFYHSPTWQRFVAPLRHEADAHWVLR